MNLQRACKNLSKALTFPTVTQADFNKIDKESFLSFLKFLETSYPLIHKNLSKTSVNTFAPIFHWKVKETVINHRKPILLIAHYDVVPALENGWEHEPFSGHISDEKIFGRGAMDDKNSVISLLETVESLLEEGYEPKRDIYLAFGFDEEVGGKLGAKKLAEYFFEKGIAFEAVLDEGGIVTEGRSMGMKEDIAVIGLAEKGNTNIELIFTGEDGHSSMPPKSTSIGKMAEFIKAVESHPRKPRLVEPVSSMLKALAPHKKGLSSFLLKHPKFFSPLITAFLQKGKQTAPMLKTTVAFTMTNSGSAPNVLPKTASCIANIRLLPGDDTETIFNWLKSFGYEFLLNPIQLEEASRCTSTNSSSYLSLKKAIHEVFPQAIISPYLMVGGTDSKHYEKVAEHIFRFMPCRLTSDDLKGMHGTNECISKKNVETMLKFYEIYIKEMNLD